MMEMPLGWRKLNGELSNHPPSDGDIGRALILLKEMAETLENISKRCEFVADQDPNHVIHHTIAENSLKKFKEWK